MHEWTEGDVDSNGVNIHFYRTGQGGKPPLLLAHGLTDNGLCWARVANALQSSFDVVMVDARNHGKSDRAPAGLKELASDMAAVIAQLGLGTAAVMGHSVGASIAAGLAAHYPAQVSRVVLEDPPWKLEPRNLSAEQDKQQLEGFHSHVRSLSTLKREEIIENGRQRYPTWHDDDLPAWAASKQQVAESAMSALQLGEWTDTAPLIQCPTLLIYASGIINGDFARAVEATNERFSSHQIADAGHNVRREQFEKFVKIAQRFLEA